MKPIVVPLSTSFDLRTKSMDDLINNLFLDITRFMKEPMFPSNTNSRSQRTHDDSYTENELSEDKKGTMSMFQPIINYLIPYLVSTNICLKSLIFMSSMLSSNISNIDLDYLIQKTKVLAFNAQIYFRSGLIEKNRESTRGKDYKWY
ncbi:hypothetical protein ACTFIW_000998 [Dictyostelium discoideum]